MGSPMSDKRAEWLYVYGVPIVWATLDGLPYTAEQLARRMERLTGTTCAIVLEDDDLYAVTVNDETVYAYTNGIPDALEACGVRVE